MSSVGSGGLCVAYAAAGGTLAVASATVLAYPAHLAKRRGVDSLYGRCGSVGLAILNVLFGLGAVGMFVLATGEGPVALAMPIQTGTMLLLNMVVQSTLRIKKFLKSMVVGTCQRVCVRHSDPVRPRSTVSYCPRSGRSPPPCVCGAECCTWLCCTWLCCMWLRGQRQVALATPFTSAVDVSGKGAHHS